MGKFLAERKPPFAQISIAAAAWRLGIPLTVHVGIGTDIIHMHPQASGAAIGEGSLRDFKYLVSSVARLEDGVYLNCGSAVVLPEVFLKAVAIARNDGRLARSADDRQPGLPAALPAAHQRGVPPNRRHRQGLLADGPSRDHDPAAGRRSHRGFLEVDLHTMRAHILTSIMLAAFTTLAGSASAQQKFQMLGPNECLNCHDHDAEREWYEKKEIPEVRRLFPEKGANAGHINSLNQMEAKKSDTTPRRSALPTSTT